MASLNIPRLSFYKIIRNLCYNTIIGWFELTLIAISYISLWTYINNLKHFLQHILNNYLCFCPNSYKYILQLNCSFRISEIIKTKSFNIIIFITFMWAYDYALFDRVLIAISASLNYAASKICLLITFLKYTLKIFGAIQISILEIKIASLN